MRESKIRRPQFVSMFDVDGVLAHPQHKRVTEKRLLSYLARDLEKGVPIAFNTGRSLAFIMAKIIRPLKTRLKKPSLLENLFIVAEKGAVVQTFNTRGIPHVQIDRSLAVPGWLARRVRALVGQKFSDVAFFDTTKKTMISVEMRDGMDLDKFKRVQPGLDSELTACIVEYGAQKKFRLDPSRISTDIEHYKTGKQLGAKKFLIWLRQKRLRPQHFFAFGDTKYDITMAAELHRQGKQVTFVYVGGRGAIARQQYPFPIHRTKELFERGTMEYLDQLEKKFRTNIL